MGLDGGDVPLPYGSGLGEAPLPPSLDLVELPENLVEGKLEGGIHGDRWLLYQMLATLGLPSDT